MIHMYGCRYMFLFYFIHLLYDKYNIANRNVINIILYNMLHIIILCYNIYFFT